mmetsp:Transcript_26845/g.57853  ORF Transcript_26845/g.57853 Transcript_26845/m.57853 type:complete len:141 (+) Transcript_26845:180-602(+)
MFEPTLAVAAQAIGCIDAILRDKVEARRAEPPVISSGVWGDDPALTSTIGEIRNISKVLSNSCIKLALLYSAAPSELAMGSLLGEFDSQMKGLLQHYLHFLTLSLSECLFDLVSRIVRSLLSHIQDLLRAVSGRRDDIIK